jgi:transposase
MAKAYSLDLRRRVFAAWQRGEGSQAEVAARFSVSESFVRDLSRRFRQSGDVAAKPHGGGRQALADTASLACLGELVAAHNDATIQEHHRSLAAAGYTTSQATVGRWLLRLGLTRKKRRSATTSAKVS